MKRGILKGLLKAFLLIACLLCTFIIVFYFWAGSSTVKSDDYFTIKSYDNSFLNNSDTFKIGTYNIGYLSGLTNNKAVDRSYALFDNNLTQLTAYIEKENPTFLAVQEIDFNASRSFKIDQLDSLARRLNFPNTAKAINWDKLYIPFPYYPISNQFGKVVSGQAILSKRQILNQSVVTLDKPINAPFYYNHFYIDRLIQTTFIRLNQEDTLVLMNVHLEAFDEFTRREQSKVVVTEFNKYQARYPVILLGDFNSVPPFGETNNNSTLTEIFAIPGIEEAIPSSSYLENPKAYFTFNSEEPYERLDYIFYTSNSIQMLSSHIGTDAGFISDHLPVWMTFTLKK